ncbi:RNA-binding ASCH domain protein [Rhynchospora pubera]|uniref:RNA-binding ASCH domain protein n=1 Tax=Rhynchospora pubera TaxID=906938 RepID=A0AAV8FTQ7_9POAL|nr:RNA-binding ASCH domain protein [Rhynchospora pubera]
MEKSEEGLGAASPGVAAVRISDAVDELLRFTLSSTISGDLDFSDLSLSSNFCSGLLLENASLTSQHLNDEEIGNGVPSYPLYKHLAKELGNSFQVGSFPRREDLGSNLPPEEQSQIKDIKWDELISKTGFELSNMYGSINFELHVQEPFFSQLKAGRKKVEGRLAAGYYNNVVQGSLLLFNKCLLLKVERVTRYQSFREMLQVETLANVLPGVATIEEGVAIYRKFYTEEKEKASGVLAISVSKPSSQPYIFMKEILNGLGYDGVGRLLGMVRTAGTVLDALPPSRSVLVSSAGRSYQPDIKGSTLTDAARALTKHAERSSEGWWGHLKGNDSQKNQLASQVINQLLDDCCWMNVHLIQPYGPVFEIRVCEGYGARWSSDGSKFIGFLEPYTVDGFSKDWKH